MQKQPWQTQLSDVITDVNELLEILEIKSHPAPLLRRGEFPLRVPRAFVARMEKGNPDDPLLKQVLPLSQELIPTPGYSTDPLDEKNANPIPGLLHKYHGRVLLTPTGACGIHCRYCFRRHFPYEENTLSSARLTAILDYLRRDTTLHEVILSGGDPLVLPDHTLRTLIATLADIPHLRTVRIHTRMPIVIPDRITPELVTCLTETRLHPVVIVHCNHPQEIDTYVRLAMQHLHTAGIPLLNQAVLLKGVNDTVECLVKLSHTLFEAHILPYTLNVLDKVQGAAHFDVSDEIAKELLWGMMQQLPGYLVPRLRREVPGMPAKMPLEFTLKRERPFAGHLRRKVKK